MERYTLLLFYTSRRFEATTPGFDRWGQATTDGLHIKLTRWRPSATIERRRSLCSELALHKHDVRYIASEVSECNWQILRSVSLSGQTSSRRSTQVRVVSRPPGPVSYTHLTLPTIYSV